MKIEKSKSLRKTENELHEILPKMVEGDSVFIGSEQYIDRKEILADVRAYNSQHSKNLKVKIEQEEEGFRLWLISNQPKKIHGLSKKDHSIIDVTIKNEVTKMEKRLEKKLGERGV